MSSGNVMGIFRGNTLDKFSEKNFREITVHGKRPGGLSNPHAELQVLKYPRLAVIILCSLVNTHTHTRRLAYT